jgi:hypothetical protein
MERRRTVAIPNSWISQLLTPVIRPTARFIVGLIAIPLLRAVRSRIQRDRAWDEELEKDLEQWIRASLVLFLATKNIEEAISAWIMETRPEIDLNENWWFAAGRLLLAIGVIESMPDQHLFPIIHPGPPRLRWNRNLSWYDNLRCQFVPVLRGLACLHLSRSSPVFAILSVIFSGTLGWVFYTVAIAQYLIIGLVTSRDKALDVLARFDQEIRRKRQKLVEELCPEQPEATGDVPDKKPPERE